ncbi:MAG: hypothetical protein ACSHX0_06140 [Akkermansiaceae bacterium]
MNNNEFPDIEPLEARCTKDGSLYFRQPKVTDRLVSLKKSSYEESCHALFQIDEKSIDYIPTECILATVRSLRKRTDCELFHNYIKELLRRVTSRLLSEDEPVQEAVLGSFTNLLANDLKQRKTTLDFYEGRFAKGLKMLIIKERARYHKQLGKRKLLEISEASSEISAEIEKASGSFNIFDPGEINKEDYLFRLSEGIERLPTLHKKIIIMWSKKILIESQDENVKTISSLLDMTPKTIRKYKNEALGTLKKFITEGETQ